MINYEEIKENNPKAWDLLQNWMQTTYTILYGESAQPKRLIPSDYFSEDERFPDRDRDLFDFFDEQGLDISILSHFDSSEKFIKRQRTYTYQLLNFDLHKVAGSFDTRSEAETAAFTNAFEILENKLSQ